MGIVIPTPKDLDQLITGRRFDEWDKGIPTPKDLDQLITQESWNRCRRLIPTPKDLDQLITGMLLTAIVRGFQLLKI